MMHFSFKNYAYGCITLLILCESAISLNVKTQPYSVINMEDDSESLKFTENAEQAKEEIPQVSRRGYAGEDFYQKAAKNIPRMGRRGVRSDELQNNQLKRPYSEQQIPEESFWPWHSDRVPTQIKRKEIVENCRYWPKIEKLINDLEFCNDNFECCSALKDSSILKRYQQTYPSKQTGQKPNYKNNQYMK